MAKKKDDLYANKVAAAVLVAGLLVFGVGYLGDAIYGVGDVPETPGYAIDGGAPIATAGVAEDVPIEAIAPLLVSADLESGANVFKKCVSCHTPNKGGANRVGPNLYEIVGADIAAKEGFAYSKVLEELPGVWNYEELNAFLLSPRKYARGTKMGFAGLKKPGDRADVILYLRSLSDNPQALPSQ